MTSPALPTPLSDLARIAGVGFAASASLLQRVATAAPSVREIGSRRLSQLIMIVIGAGTLLSILTTTDPLWWQLHFSRLGTFDDFSGRVFNATLVAAGAIIVWFAIRVRRELAELEAWRAARITRTALIVLMGAVGVSLGGAGALTVDTNEFLHDRAASGIMLSFLGILVVALRERKRMSRRLTGMTLAVITILVAAIIVFVLGYINLAALELIGFTMIFTWIGEFTRSVEQLRVNADTPQAGESAETLPRVSAPRAPADPDGSAARPGLSHSHPHASPSRRRLALRSGRRLRPRRVARRLPNGSVLRHDGARDVPARLRPGCTASEAPRESAPSRR